MLNYICCFDYSMMYVILLLYFLFSILISPVPQWTSLSLNFGNLLLWHFNKNTFYAFAYNFSICAISIIYINKLLTEFIVSYRA